MSEKTSLSKDYKEYFLLDEGKLRKLVDVLMQYSRKKDYECEVDYKVEKAGNAEYTSHSIDTILSDDNIKRKEVRKLTIALHKSGDDYSYSRKMGCTIEFNSEGGNYSSPVKYSVKDDDERWAFALYEELDAYIQRALIPKSRRFNWLFSFLDDILVPVLVFILFVLAINVAYPISRRRLGDLNLVEFGVTLAAGIAITLISFDNIGSLKPFQRISNFMKVNSVFYWGDQKEMYDAQRSFRQNIKWIVIIGFLVSAAAGGLVAVLLNR